MSGEGGADGGVDIVLSRGSDRYFVQCEQWKARQVRVTTVRELYGVMAAQGAAGGYVVTSGVFTDEARRFAKGREIELIGGDRLVEMISAQFERGAAMGVGDARPRLDSRRHGNDKLPSVAPHPSPLPARGERKSSADGAHPPTLDPGSKSGVTTATGEVPACPQCGSPMVLRTARKGAQAGSSFWGCSTLPKCRGTRPAEG